MLRLATLVSSLIVLSLVPVSAKQRHVTKRQTTPAHVAFFQGPWNVHDVNRSHRRYHQKKRWSPVRKHYVKRRHSRAASTSLSGVVAPLAAKARELMTACGSRVISSVRHTRIAGTSRMSLHASGRAVDMAGNPSCMYSRLKSWPGGYTTDYGRMAHVHISYGGSEHGLRFAHGGGGKKRYASKRRYVRVAWRR